MIFITSYNIIVNAFKHCCRSLRSLLQICQQSSGGEVEDQQRQQEEEGEEKVTK